MKFFVVIAFYGKALVDIKQLTSVIDTDSAGVHICI